MKIATREFKDGFGKDFYYEDVDSRFVIFHQEIRVLPAKYHTEPSTLFTLKARYEPGIHKMFPNGGFELYDSSGGTHYYALDAVIVHPWTLGMDNYFKTDDETKQTKIKKIGGKRGRPRKEGSELKAPYVPTGKSRGRARLSDEERVAREANNKKVNTGGKRGRPSKLSPEERIAKAEAFKYVPTGKRRGRPSSKSK